MRHLKLPLIVTGISFVLVVIVAILAITHINNAKIGSAEKAERAQKFGGSLAIVTCLVIAPFWVIAAAKAGKERRAARQGEVDSGVS
jgi:tetrahydromethanopterin S-methyltransferase subunit C